MPRTLIHLPGVMLILAAVAYSALLQHFPQYGGNSGFNDGPVITHLSPRWIVINGLSIFCLVRFSGAWGHLLRAYASLLVALNVTSIVFYASRLTHGAIAAGFETDPGELAGLYGLIGALPCLTFIGTLAFLTIVAARLPKAGRMAAVFLALTLLIIPVKLLVQTLTHNQSVTFLKWQRWPVAGTVDYYQDMILLSDLVAAGSYWLERRELARSTSSARSLPAGLKLDAAAALDSRPVKIVLVIGESAARAHHGIYGYSQPTDPFLQDIARDESRTTVVRNALSPAPVTREALIRLLSFASPLDDSPFRDQLNIVELAKRSGYETAWISNQKMIGLHDTPTGMVADTADFMHFEKHDGSDTYRGVHDLELVKPFGKVYRKDDSRQFIVLHLMGSHMNYDDRYDAEDFQATDGSPPEVHSYDASVHHTDRVLRAIAEQIEDAPSALLIYVSDHGEIVNVGHGRMEFILEQFRIPLVAYGLRVPMESIDALFAKYSTATGDVFNTTNLIYVLGEILGYSVNAETREQAVQQAGSFFDVDNHFYPLSVLQ